MHSACAFYYIFFNFYILLVPHRVKLIIIAIFIFPFNRNDVNILIYLRIQTLFMNETDIKSFLTHIRLLGRESRFFLNQLEGGTDISSASPFSLEKNILCKLDAPLRENRFLSKVVPNERNLIKF